MIPKEEFKQIQERRKCVYTFIAKMFERPLAQKDIDALAQANLTSFDCGDNNMSHGLKVMALYLKKRNTGTREVLNRDYTSAFYGIQDIDGIYALPYESAYENPNQLLTGKGRRKVFNIYKRCALCLKEGLDTPEDHLSYMCEFLSILAQRCTIAYENEDISTVKENLLLEHAFIKAHVLSWYEKFAHVAAGIVEERFYKGLLEFSGAFFLLDEAVLISLLREAGVRSISFDLSRLEKPRTSDVSEEKDIYRIRLDKALCIRKRGGLCGKCAEICPKHIDPVLDQKSTKFNECKNCGLCIEKCPAGALYGE